MLKIKDHEALHDFDAKKRMQGCSSSWQMNHHLEIAGSTSFDNEHESTYFVLFALSVGMHLVLWEFYGSIKDRRS